MEKHYDAEKMTKDGATKLAVRALLEVVESGSKNIEVLIISKDSRDFLEEESLSTLVTAIEKEKEEEEAKRKAKGTGSTNV